MTRDEDMTLRVHQITYEAEGVVSLTLTAPDRRELPGWSAGAHLELVLGSGLVRQYSLCGDPADRTRYRVAVLREPAGRGGSAEVHDSLRVGQLLTVRGPRNRFALVEAESYVLIAGGIGITPLLPMVRELAGRTTCTLVYGGRSRHSMAFLQELAGLSDVTIAVRPQDEHGLLDLDDIFARCRPDTAIYCCGPPGLITVVQDRCVLEDRTDALHVERFSAGPLSESTTDAPLPSDEIFEVELARTEAIVKVEPDKSILEAVRGVVPDMPSSCEEGICGTCEVRVLGGTPVHHDSILSDSEREVGDCMFLCVSRAGTPRLVIDL